MNPIDKIINEGVLLAGLAYFMIFLFFVSIILLLLKICTHLLRRIDWFWFSIPIVYIIVFVILIAWIAGEH